MDVYTLGTNDSPATSKEIKAFVAAVKEAMPEPTVKLYQCRKCAATYVPEQVPRNQKEQPVCSVCGNMYFDVIKRAAGKVAGYKKLLDAEIIMSEPGRVWERRYRLEYEENGEIRTTTQYGRDIEDACRKLGIDWLGKPEAEGRRSVHNIVQGKLQEPIVTEFDYGEKVERKRRKKVPRKKAGVSVLHDLNLHNLFRFVGDQTTYQIVRKDDRIIYRDTGTGDVYQVPVSEQRTRRVRVVEQS